MNVKGLPFEDSPHGALFVAGLTAVVTVALLVFLKRRKWF
jgi:magnesium transporter